MAQQPFLDPYAQFQIDPNQGVDPGTMQSFKRGQRAQGELEQIQGGSPMANALRMSQAGVGGVQGQGLSATAPGIAEALSAVSQQYVGNQQLREMEAQAKALRGDVAAGEDAALQMQSQRDTYEEQQRLARRQAEIQLQRQLADEAEQRRIAAENRKYDREAQEAASELKEETQFLDLPAAAQKGLDQAYDTITGVNSILQKREELSPKDKMELGKISSAVAEMATPAQLENWMKKNVLNWSDSLKGYLESTARFAAVRTNQLYGGQLTGNEIKRALSFMPNAGDLDDEGIVRRLRMFGDEADSYVRDRAERYEMPNLTDHYDWENRELRRQKEMERRPSTLDAQETPGPTLEGVESEIAELAEALGMTVEEAIQQFGGG